MFCKRTKEFLLQHGIVFEERDVISEEGALDELQRRSLMTTPVTIIADEAVVELRPSQPRKVVRHCLVESDFDAIPNSRGECASMFIKSRSVRGPAPKETDTMGKAIQVLSLALGAVSALRQRFTAHRKNGPTV